jgi:predicted alpha/beta superfamily hydrolase
MHLRLILIFLFLPPILVFGQTPPDSYLLENKKTGKSSFKIRAIARSPIQDDSELYPLESESDTSQYGAISHYRIIARENSGSYRIKVTLPPGYTPEKRYKTLYYLDSWWLSESIIGVHALLSLTLKIEPLILVGVANTGNFDSWYQQRTFDFTPSKLSKENTNVVVILQSPKYMNPESTGGALQFLNFLEGTIMPEVEASYSAEPEQSGIIGHSLGGLFGFYSLQAKPDLFKYHLLISPSLWWEAAEIINDGALENLAQLKVSHSLFISYGADEAGLLVNPIKRLDSFLDTASVKMLKYVLVPYEKRDHHSVIPPSLYDGLMFLYKKR